MSVHTNGRQTLRRLSHCESPEDSEVQRETKPGREPGRQGDWEGGRERDRETARVGGRPIGEQESIRGTESQRMEINSSAALRAVAF